MQYKSYHSCVVCAQVYTIYRVVDSLRDALKACPDITVANYPQLAENLSPSKTTGNLSKLTTKWIKLVSIFVARIYEAVRISSLMRNEVVLSPFDIATYPILKECFDTLETYLQSKAHEKVKVAKERTTNELLKDISGHIMALESFQDKVKEQMSTLKQDFDVLSSTVKIKKTKKRKRSGVASPSSPPAAIPPPEEMHSLLQYWLSMSEKAKAESEK